MIQRTSWMNKMEGFLKSMRNFLNDLSDYLQDDMLHPNEKGVEIIVQAILPKFIDFIESFSEK